MVNVEKVFAEVQKLIAKIDSLKLSKEQASQAYHRGLTNISKCREFLESKKGKLNELDPATGKVISSESLTKC